MNESHNHIRRRVVVVILVNFVAVNYHFCRQNCRRIHLFYCFHGFWSYLLLALAIWFNSHFVIIVTLFFVVVVLFFYPIVMLSSLFCCFFSYCAVFFLNLTDRAVFIDFFLLYRVAVVIFFLPYRVVVIIIFGFFSYRAVVI